MPAFIADEAGFKKAREIKSIIGYALKSLDMEGAEVSIFITDDDGIRELNRKFRRIDKATDVLSFPMNDGSMLGDIVISMDRLIRQADEFGVSVGEELSRLLIHGLLHLIGYDHVKGGAQARKMKTKEGELMTGLKAKGLV